MQLLENNHWGDDVMWLQTKQSCFYLLKRDYFARHVMPAVVRGLFLFYHMLAAPYIFTFHLTLSFHIKVSFIFIH